MVDFNSKEVSKSDRVRRAFVARPSSKADYVCYYGVLIPHVCVQAPLVKNCWLRYVCYVAAAFYVNLSLLWLSLFFFLF